jgi:crossover junction endodeoxyribonuclease RusA
MTEDEHDYQVRKAAQWRPGSVAVGAAMQGKLIWFFVPGLPVAQPRQRHANIGGHVRNYIPKSDPVHTFKATVRMSCQQALPDDWTPDGPMRVSAEFVFPRPKSMTKKSGNEREPKITKPDLDNLTKALYDALTGVAWNDDKQVYDEDISKWVAGDVDKVGVTITISGGQ